MATLSRNTALKTFPGLKQSDLEDLPCSWRSCHGNSYPMYQRSDVDKVVAAKRAGDKGFAAAQDKQATAAAVCAGCRRLHPPPRPLPTFWNTWNVTWWWECLASPPPPPHKVRPLAPSRNPTEHTTPDRWCPLTVRFDVRVQEEYVSAPDSTLGTSVTWYMDVSEYLRVSLAVAPGGKRSVSGSAVGQMHR